MMHTHPHSLAGGHHHANHLGGGAISCHYMEDNLNTNYELSKIATITTEFSESLYLTI